MKLTCDKCEFTAASRVVMRRHERQYHVAEVPYSCELCDSGFTERKDFNRHMESTHGGHKFRNFIHNFYITIKMLIHITSFFNLCLFSRIRYFFLFVFTSYNIYILN